MKYSGNDVLVSNKSNSDAVLEVLGMVVSCDGLFGLLRGGFLPKRYIVRTAIGIIEEEIAFIDENFDKIGDMV